jgi:DNA processing protein
MQSPVLSREEELHWLALKLIPGLGTRTRENCGSVSNPAGHFRASRTEPEGAGERHGGTVDRQRMFVEDAVTQQEKMAEAGAVCGDHWRPRSPKADIFDPPILRLRGRVELLRWAWWGRGVHALRLAVAERMSGDLAHAGLPYQRHGAGIDTAAHKGAPPRAAPVAVLGCGVTVYPSETESWPRNWRQKG